MPKTDGRKKPPKIYKPPPDWVNQVKPTRFSYSVQCPKCNGRAMDISDLPERPITWSGKCPICHNFVDIPLVAPVVHEHLALFDI